MQVVNFSQIGFKKDKRPPSSLAEDLLFYFTFGTNIVELCAEKEL